MGQIDGEAHQPDAEAEAPLVEEAIADRRQQLHRQVVGTEECDRAENARDAHDIVRGHSYWR
eukprot:scaffold13003_cov70-Phaeocystis_antarctica.AAC.6